MNTLSRAVLMISMAALAIGAQPAEAQPKVAGDQAGPLERVRTSVSRVLTIVQAPHAVSVASGGGQRRTEIRRIAQGLFDFNEMARLTLARKIATIVLIVWKRGVSFDAQYLKSQTA